MKLRILSDLHLEGRDWTYVSKGEDVVILAGDVCSRTPVGMVRRDRLLASIKVPTVYVLGNHEFYHGYMSRRLVTDQIRGEVSRFSHVHLLDDQAVTIDGVTFAGSTLWSAFHLPHPRVDRARLMAALPLAISDFSHIAEEDGEPLTPCTMAGWAQASTRWLATTLASASSPVVVVTHFLPSARSIAPRYADEALNAYFCHPADQLIRPPVALWAHGHTHDACSYVDGGVRVVCNPLGYAGERSGYDPDLVVTL